MEYKVLGNTGMKVSSLCMGTMTFGAEADRQESAAMFTLCRDAGINFFDCANVYSQGCAETILGELAAGEREKLVLATKVGGQMGSDINSKGLSRKNIFASLEASLRRLKTSYIDIYFLHKFDPSTPFEETLAALDILVRQGKVRYVGVSNLAAWQMAKACGVSALHDWATISCIQPMYNLVKRQAEVEILPFAQAENIGVVSYNPLGGGLLTGKYGKQFVFSEHRLARLEKYRIRYGEDWMLEAAVQFAHLAKSRGLSVPGLAVAWAAAHPAVTAPIIGARNCSQLKESLGSVDLSMTPDLYAEISALVPAPPPATDRTDDIIQSFH